MASIRSLRIWCIASLALAAQGELAVQAQAEVLRVPAAFPTIRSAATEAQAGDTILVSPGIYDESIPPLPGIVLRGGVTLISESGPQSTVVRGPGLGLAGNPPHLACVVEGFTFRAGDDDNGPGVFNEGQGTAIRNCRLEGLRDLGEDFTSNRGIQVEDCTLIGYNIHLGTGQTGQTFMLRRNVIDARPSDETIVPYGSNLFIVRSNTFIAPRSIFAGGFLQPTAHVELVNNILYAPVEFTQGFYCSLPAVFDVRYNCFFNVIPEPVCPIGPTNLFADPEFCNAAAEDYYLKQGSPCANSGEHGVAIGSFPVGCGVAGVPADASPSRPGRLLREFANPLVLGRPFMLDIEQTALVRVRFVDASGRTVAILFDGFLGSGTHALHWNGRLSDGRRVPSGIYYMTVETPSYRESHRALFIR